MFMLIKHINIFNISNQTAFKYYRSIYIIKINLAEKSLFTKWGDRFQNISYSTVLYSGYQINHK